MIDFKTKLKSRFRAGAIPSESDFALLIDAILTRDDLRQALADMQAPPQQPPSESPASSLEELVGDRLSEERDRSQAALDMLHRRLEDLDARIIRDLATLRSGTAPRADDSLSSGEVAKSSPADQGTATENPSGSYPGQQAVEATISLLHREIDILRKQQAAPLGPLANPRARAIPASALWKAPTQAPAAEINRLSGEIDERLAAARALESATPERVAMFPADGAWHEIPVDAYPAVYRVQAFMGPESDRSQDSALLASVVFMNARSKPSIAQQRCFDGGPWLWLVPPGIVATAAGTALALWPRDGEPISIVLLQALGALLVVIGLALVAAATRRHSRTALWLAWSRMDPFVSVGSGGLVFKPKSAGHLKIRSFGRCPGGKQVRTVECKLSRLDA